jgi:hypothetical protein
MMQVENHKKQTDDDTVAYLYNRLRRPFAC